MFLIKAFPGVRDGGRREGIKGASFPLSPLPPPAQDGLIFRLESDQLSYGVFQKLNKQNQKGLMDGWFSLFHFSKSYTLIFPIQAFNSKNNCRPISFWRDTQSAGQNSAILGQIIT